ncbi:MAG: hypothetical protein ABIN74_05070 [Ferruginibacter sp.]
MPEIPKVEAAPFTISLKYHEHSNHFFVVFSDQSGDVISLKISEAVANGLSKDLNLKITS